MTGDDHANGGTAGRFDIYNGDSAPGCSVADWECVRGTSYIYPEHAAHRRAGRGRTAHRASRSALHVDDRTARDWTPRVAATTSTRRSSRSSHAELPERCRRPQTNRTHCIVWSDYATQPQVELANGIRLDTNYYYWPPTVGQRRARACSPAPACRCASPTPTAR